MTGTQRGSALLATAVQRLAQAGVADPARDARKLFAHAAGVDAGRLSLVLPEPVTRAVAAQFDALIARRAQFEPVSHLVGVRAFYGRDFIVTKDVLDPRPDTETLIDAALSAPFARVLDLGTGSGCILVTLLAENAQATGMGADLSPAALEVARRNAQRHAVTARAQFVQSDWMAQVTGAFDLIVANPPYIAADEMPKLARDVRDWEPRLALTDEADGLSAYRRIVTQAGAALTQAGRLMFEIGPSQGAAVSQLMRDAGFADVCVIPDLDARDRVVTGKATGF